MFAVNFYLFGVLFARYGDHLKSKFCLSLAMKATIEKDHRIINLIFNASLFEVWCYKVIYHKREGRMGKRKRNGERRRTREDLAERLCIIVSRGHREMYPQILQTGLKTTLQVLTLCLTYETNIVFIKIKIMNKLITSL